MASQALQVFRMELLDQLTILEPRLEGLQELGRHEMSAESKAVVTAESQVYTQRIQMIDATLADMDALEADGYPEIPQGNILGAIKDELEHEVNVTLAALDAFAVVVPVTAVEVTFDEPVPKANGDT
jgi:hypothetical protein